MSDSAEEFGNFKVYERLGIGGVATVHRATQRGVEGFRKAVALKRLLPHLMMSTQIVEAFVREARLASHLQHPNIAQTYELGKVGKTYFISMEFVPGPTLEQIMQHSQAVAGAIPVPVTLGIVLQICDALDYAHNHTDPTGKPLGIIHRDVSPPNVIVSNTGIVKLLDFGIAKIQNDANPNTTGQNVIKGRFNYIAPEYLGGKLDARADLFAIGVIAHELLTGRRLFDGTNDFDTSAKVLNMPIQPPSRWASQVPTELDHIVLTALQRDPDQRWQSAIALRTALANVARETCGVADHSQILSWVQWAFTQREAPDTGKVAKVLDLLDQTTSNVAILTPEQQADLDSFSEPQHTLPGVGEESELMRSGERARLARASQPSGLDALAHGGSKPMMVAAKPLVQKRGMALGSLTPAVGETIADEQSGVVVMPAPPKKARGGWRWLVYVLIVLIAAGGGVLAAAYFLEIELPFDLPFIN